GCNRRKTSLDSTPSRDGAPIPDQHDPLTAGFWGAANEERLVIQRCRNCRTFHHPPLGICWDCLSTDLTFEEMTGKGHIYSYAIVRDQRLPAFDSIAPFIVASVSLDDAPEITLTTNLPGTSLEEVRIGMPVEVEFEEIAPGI